MPTNEADIRRYEELLAIALDFARFGQTDELEKMLQAKLPINLSDHKGNTLLMLSSYNGNAQTVKMLLEMGADANQKNDRGQTPLEGVCFKGYLEIVKLLIDGGAKNGGDNSNAVIYASMFGNRDIVEYLVGKERNLKTNLYLLLSKFTSLFRACQKTNKKTFALR